MHDATVFALHSLSPAELPVVVAQLERIAADPEGATDSYTDWRGDRVRVRLGRRFWIYFSVLENGEVVIEEILRPR